MRVDLGVPYEEAVERTIAALRAEGFGVLTGLASAVPALRTLRIDPASVLRDE